MATQTGNAETIAWQVVADAGPLASATTRAPFTVANSRVDEFQRDGVVALPGAFTEWVEPLRAGVERVLTSPGHFAFPCESTGADQPGRFFDAYCNWQRVPEFLAFVLTSGAASLAAQCMQSATAQLFHEHFFVKEPGTAKATPWHHDLPYYCVDGTQTASVYVALDDMPAETAVSFVKGSHRDGRLYTPRRFLDGAAYETGDPSMELSPDADSAQILAARLRAGDAYVFDFRTLHGASAAPNTDRRRAFSTRWLGDDVRYSDRPGETSPPLRGLGLHTGDRMREDMFPILWP